MLSILSTNNMVPPKKDVNGVADTLRSGRTENTVEQIHQPPMAGNHSNTNNNLNLLDGDNYSWLDMDEKTLQCLVGGLPLPDVGHLYNDDVAGPSNPSKRLCMCGSPTGEHSQPESWIPLQAKEPTVNATKTRGTELPVQDVNVHTNAHATSTKAPENQSAKKRTNAAAAKADRERKRRERLNQCFEDLANACGQEGGSSFRSDRLTVIVDAIRVVRALRVEVNQLRQLNKFLEERVGTLERERAQTMYQQYSAPHGGNANHHSYVGIPSSHAPCNHQHPLLGSHGGAKNQSADGQYNFLPAANLSEDEKLRPPAA